MMNRRRWTWLVAGLIVLLLAAGVLRALSARQQRQAVVAQASLPKTQTVVELAAGDVVTAQTVELSQGLPLSGSLKAVNSAVLKARAAGELQGLAVREGDTVRAGQVLARIDSTDSQARLRQAREQAASAQTQIDIAQRQFDNNQALVNQGFISRTALDTSQSNLQAARSTHQAALAAVDVAVKALDDTVLRAPISGVVAARLVQPGERVAVEARVVEIVDLSRLELEASLGPADSVLVRVGQQAQLQVEGIGQPIAARVARINPSAQAGSRNVLAYLALADATGLRQGLFAQGTLATGSSQALAVPLSAVRTDKPLPYVQVVENQQVAHKAVTTGARGEAGKEAMVAVTGVAAGAVVLRGHLGALREGTSVKLAKPASAP